MGIIRCFDSMQRTSMLVTLRTFALLAALILTPAAMTAAYAPVPAPDTAASAAPAQHAGGEANLVLPDLSTETFRGINARTLLMGGLGVCLAGLAFGMIIFTRLKNMPVHRSMLE